MFLKILHETTLEGCQLGTGFNGSFGLTKRAIKPRPQLAPQPNQLLPNIHDMLHYQADYSNANPAGCSK